jgi:hypothetical protein
MHCPECGCEKSRVVDTRNSDAEVRRSRVCSKCQHKWNTVEASADVPVVNTKTLPTQHKSYRIPAKDGKVTFTVPILKAFVIFCGTLTRQDMTITDITSEKDKNTGDLILHLELRRAVT